MYYLIHVKFYYVHIFIYLFILNIVILNCVSIPLENNDITNCNLKIILLVLNQFAFDLKH